MAEPTNEPAPAVELERAAAFRSALRRFLDRTEIATTAGGLTPQRRNLLLAIKTGRGESSTVTELSERLDLRQAAVVEREPSPSDGRVSVLRRSAEGERRLLEAFVALREARSGLVLAPDEVGARFREYADPETR